VVLAAGENTTRVASCAAGRILGNVIARGNWRKQDISSCLGSRIIGIFPLETKYVPFHHFLSAEEIEYVCRAVVQISSGIAQHKIINTIRKTLMSVLGATTKSKLFGGLLEKKRRYWVVRFVALSRVR
jgi:hypothetical protein